MTTVYFVRHAEPNHANRNDRTRELTDKGLKDTALVTQFFRDKNIDCMLSSPYKRAVDTIADLAQQRHLPIALVEDFRERKVDSVWIEDFTAFSKAQWEDFSYQLSDGECLQDVQMRNIAALKQVLLSHPNQTAVIGSHGTALSMMINYYDASFGYTDFERIRKLMPWIVKFVFDGETCVSITEYDIVNRKEKLRSV